MTPALRRAINELLDAAEYALGPLDQYSDYEDSPYDLRPEPNAALIAHSALKGAIALVERNMPPEESK